MDKPTEMELRVANAIEEAVYPREHPEVILNIARAAIRAMREPTKDMMDAYLKAEPMLDDAGWNGPAAIDAWHDMIDTASPPKPE